MVWSVYDFNQLKPSIVNILETASPPANAFVALDIDATVLNGIGLNVEPEPAAMFVREVALEHNLPVVYITAREDSAAGRAMALLDLAAVGITNPYRVILRPSHVQTWEGIGLYKASARARLEAETNSRCVMNVGDQWTDMMPTSDRSGLRLRCMFRDKYVLYDQLSDGVQRWSLKLK